MNQNTYEHSRVFASLKSKEEGIKNNLTSFQYLSVLDDLIYRAILPLLAYTRYVDEFMAQVLGWQNNNPRRKASSLDRQQLNSRIVMFLVTSEGVDKAKVLRSARLDRGILLEMLNRWIETYEINSKDPLLQRRACWVSPKVPTSGVYHQVVYWRNQAARYKALIMEKYNRLCLVTAQRDYKLMEFRIPLDDIVQSYILTCSKAIDKCDPQKGVLTSHIQNWLKSAKTKLISAYLERGTRVQSGNTEQDSFESAVDSDELDAVTTEDEDNRDLQSVLYTTRIAARIADPFGLGRIAMGIEEVLSKQDKELLHAHAL